MSKQICAICSSVCLDPELGMSSIHLAKYIYDVYDRLISFLCRLYDSIQVPAFQDSIQVTDEEPYLRTSLKTLRWTFSSI